MAILPIGVLLVGACSRPSYLEVELTLPTSPVDFAQQVEWLDLSAMEGGHSAGPQRIPGSPVAAGLGNANPKILLAVSAPPGSTVAVMINGLDAAGKPIGSASGSKLIGSGTTSLSLTLTQHCDTTRDCDPSALCSGVVACDADAKVGFGACIEQNAGVPDAGTPCGSSDAGHCDGRGACLLPFCGDGVLQPDSGEQCDEGAGNSDELPDHCRNDCQRPHCGDGILDRDAGEICDLDGGHNGLGLGCNATCSLTGTVTTLSTLDAGGSPYGLAVIGDSLYIADSSFRVLSRLDLVSGVLLGVAGIGDAGPGVGRDGLGTAAAFAQMHALLAFDGGVLIADQAALRLFTPGASLDGGTVTTLAGSIGDGGPPPVSFQGGPFAVALYANPYGMTQIGGVIYSNARSADLIVASDLDAGEVSQLAQVGSEQMNGVASLGTTIYASTLTSLYAIDSSSPGSQVRTLLTQLSNPDGLCTDGSTLFVCMAGGRTVQQLDPSTGLLSLIAGSAERVAVVDGLGADAGFFDPANCAWDPVRRALYVSDRGGHRIRKIQ